MNKNVLHSTLLLVSIAVSLSVGYFVGSKNASPKISGQKVIATYSVNGTKKNIELKDVTDKLASDFSDFERMVYLQKRQAIFDIVGEEIRKNNDFSKIDMPSISPQDFDKMLISLKLDKKKLTDKQKSDILGNMVIAERNQKIKSIVDEKQKEMNVRLFMDPPFSFVKRQQTGSLLISGDPKNPIEFIFYGNLHCPQCLQAYQNLMNLEAQFPEKFKIYFKYLGLEPDQAIAFKTAKSFYCLSESQKKSGLVNKLLKAYFSKVPDSMESLFKTMADLGLETKEMEKCLETKDNNSLLRTDAQAGQELSRSVAAFYVVNNYFVHGAEQKVFVEDLIHFLLKDM